MRKLTLSFLAVLGLALAGCGQTYRDKDVAMTSMAVFEPQRYAGLWYEVASFPNTFQKGCRNAQADYTLIDETQLAVRNACLREDGLSVIEGTATVTGPGRLQLRLNGVPFPAEYWVLWVDKDYETAVVGTPSGRSGWILNRTPDIAKDRLDAARDVLQFNGYDITRLVMSPQEATK